MYNNINGIQWDYVRKYTMVQFDFKIKGCIFIDTWWFIYSTFVYQQTFWYILAMLGGCNGVIYSTVKLKKHNMTASIQVFTNIGCTVLGHIHCIRKT